MRPSENDAFRVTETAADGASNLAAGLTSLLQAQPAVTVQAASRAVMRQPLADLLGQRSALTDQLEDARREAVRDRGSLLLRLLNVADSLDRIIRLTDPDNEVSESLSALRTQFLDILEEQDVAPIELQPGQPFDPRVAEVSQRQPRSDVAPDTILTIERRGFQWQGQVLRRTRVVVATSVE